MAAISASMIIVNWEKCRVRANKCYRPVMTDCSSFYPLALFTLVELNVAYGFPTQIFHMFRLFWVTLAWARIWVGRTCWNEWKYRSIVPVSFCLCCNKWHSIQIKVKRVFSCAKSSSKPSSPSAPSSSFRWYVTDIVRRTRNYVVSYVYLAAASCVFLSTFRLWLGYCCRLLPLLRLLQPATLSTLLGGEFYSNRKTSRLFSQLVRECRSDNTFS